MGLIFQSPFSGCGMGYRSSLCTPHFRVVVNEGAECAVFVLNRGFCDVSFQDHQEGGWEQAARWSGICVGATVS